MKKWFRMCLVVGIFATAAHAQQRQRFADTTTRVDPAGFPLTVHVTHSYRSHPHEPNTLATLRLDVLIQGKKLELVNAGSLGLLRVGDYKGRLVEDHVKENGVVTIVYELLLPDGTHYFFDVIGEV